MVTINLPPYKSPYTRGSIILDPKAKLQNGKIKPKFFLLVEDYAPGKESYYAFMTTSKRDHYNPRRMLKVKAEKLTNGYTVILFNNSRQITTKELLDCQVFTSLAPEEMFKFNQALTGYLRKSKKFSSDEKNILVPGYRDKNPSREISDERWKLSQKKKEPLTFGKDWEKLLKGSSGN